MVRVSVPRKLKGHVLSLCDLSANMVQPWLEAGYHCTILDIQHPPGESTLGLLTTIGDDVTTWKPPPGRDYHIIFAAPPCTNLAFSGARWFKDKGLAGLIDGLRMVEGCLRICEAQSAPWMIENPMSTLQTYWRKPDFKFDPCDYGGYPHGEDDTYTKNTCLWTGNGFVMPPKRVIDTVGVPRIHWMSPGPDRARLRSVTPLGFAYAVYEANT